MTTPSVSFRITRHTEDLAQTIHALLQRVVQLEQRLQALEADHSAPEEELPQEQLASLAHVDQLLRDCRELLAVDLPRPASVGMAQETGTATLALAADPSGEDALSETLEDVA